MIRAARRAPPPAFPPQEQVMKEVEKKRAPEVSGGHQWPGVTDPPFEEGPYPVDYPASPGGCTLPDVPVADYGDTA
jgi:hypothetical protein